MFRKPESRYLRFVKKISFWKHWNETEKSFKPLEKLLNPLPIPHPAFITVLVYNRDVDDPLPIDSKVCHEILHSIDDSSIGENRRSSLSENDGCRHYTIEEESKDCGILDISTQRSEMEPDKISPDSFVYPQSLISDESTAQPHPITWTLHRMEVNQIQKNNSFAQVGLASPEEDISISMDEHHIIFGSNKNFEFGTNV